MLKRTIVFYLEIFKSEFVQILMRHPVERQLNICIILSLVQHQCERLPATDETAQASVSMSTHPVTGANSFPGVTDLRITLDASLCYQKLPL